MWIDVRDRMPELTPCPVSGIISSDEVLCMCRKFGHNGVKDNTPYGYELLWWDGKM
jgi:hypothetical protein